MKLKCTKHDRRVITGKNGFLHRTGDMSPCDSFHAGFSSTTTPSLNRQYTYDEFLNQSHLLPTIDLTRHDG